MERARAIRVGLGGSVSLFEPFPPKPRGVRWKSYWSLEEKYERYNRASLRCALEWLVEPMHKPRNLEAAERKALGTSARESASAKSDTGRMVMGALIFQCFPNGVTPLQFGISLVTRLVPLAPCDKPLESQRKQSV
jgi:hypothetical protein